MLIRSFTRRVLSAALVLTLVAAPAWAHFVWIESAVDGMALLVRSGFGESEGWDPDLIERLQAAKYWTRTSGELKPLDVPLDKTEKERRVKVSGPRPTAVLGQCDFGVVQLGSRPATWLRYTAKHLVGAAPSWSDQKANAEFRIEVLASQVGGKVRMQVLHLGKPLAGATINATPPQGDSLKLTTDDKGFADWTLVGPGKYACFVGTTIEGEGKLGEKSYASMKDYTTLTFEIVKGDAPAAK